MDLDTMTIFLSYLEAEIWQKTLMLVAAILKSKIALIPLCYYHHNWPPRPRKHGFRHQNYLLSCLEAAIWLILWFWWRPFWNPTWPPTNANPSPENYLSWFWRS